MVYYSNVIKCTFLCLIFNAIASGYDLDICQEAWQNSCKMTDNCKMSFKISRFPTEEIVSNLTGVEEKYQDEVEQMYSRREGSIQISIKGPKIRYDQVEETSAVDLNYKASNSNPFKSLKKTAECIEIHGTDKFYYHSAIDRSGCIRADWPYKPMTPISRIMSPDVTKYDLKTTDVENYIVEIRDKESSYAAKYYLDPQNGMMPKKIEYYQVLANGNLFMYQFFVVHKYKQTDKGAYIPEECALYDYASNHGNNVSWEVEEKYSLDALDDVNIPADSEFAYKFPPGTLVDDYIANVSYRVLEGGAELSGATDQTYFEELQKPSQEKNLAMKSYNKNEFDDTTKIQQKEDSTNPAPQKMAIDSKKQPHSVMLQTEMDKSFKNVNLLWIIGIIVAVAIVFVFYKKKNRQSI